MKYLITGYKGQLGYDLKRELLKNKVSEEDILAIDKDEMDITDSKQVEKVVTSFKPDIIFHCAAWTAVDKAEDNLDLVTKVNVLGTKNMVDASLKVKATIFYMSTDYVFDGTKEGKYLETDKVNPQSVYGLTKYQGEEEVRRNPQHFITRISWVFGYNGNNFIKTMLKLASTHTELNVVNDQIGTPTYTVDLAHLLYEMSKTTKYGTYNATNEDYCSWAQFAKYIFKQAKLNVKVNEVSTDAYLKLTGTKQAYRPRNSKLDKTKLVANGFAKLPTWEDATNRYLKEIS
jgi:dTDP-4-dehydrorhamnose reductase